MTSILGKSPHSTAPVNARRRDGAIDDMAFAMQELHERYPDPAICPRCDVAFSGGRWQWMLPPAGAFWVLCPACRRVEDAYPAGTVRIAANFSPELREEVIALIHDEAVAERDEHPLNRLMALDGEAATIVATTTDTQLAQRICDALRERYDGSLAIRYSEDDSCVVADWSFAAA